MVYPVPALGAGVTTDLLPFDADQPRPPIAGRSVATRAASRSGAVYATTGRGTKIARLRALLASPRTLQELAALTGWPISSICSLHAALKPGLIEVGTVAHVWPDGRTTQRTRWQRRTNR